MIEVHHLNNSRSQRVLWLLEELQIPYKIIFHQRDAKTMLAPDTLLQVHPLGKSPVIVDGDLVLPESGAIVEFITERYGKGRLMPKRESADYARYLYWLHYSEGSIMFPVILTYYAVRFGAAMDPVRERAQGQRKLHFDFVESELAKSQYLVGNAFSAADVEMSFPLEMAGQDAVGSYPNISNYLARIQARPAYKAALEKGGVYDMGVITNRRG
ncbi:MAG: glutathione S-transferase family protein [Rhodospirillaceae bacterium]|nr:glutathione S-transferase family protein [Rhodospirillaceae bacterium]